jgi:hypothetical protein
VGVGLRRNSCFAMQPTSNRGRIDRPATQQMLGASGLWQAANSSTQQY